MNKTNRIVKAISASKGRFFGLTTRQDSDLTSKAVEIPPFLCIMILCQQKENRLN